MSSAFERILQSLNIYPNSRIVNLMKRPKRPKGVNRPHVNVPEPHQVVQMDLLSLPHDNNYKYALTAIDLHTKQADAEPLKTKRQNEVLKASKKIFNRGNVQKPQHRLEIDNGKEFNALQRYLEESDVFVRRNKAGRHRQQALVENLNKTLGKAIFTLQNVNELNTGNESVEWVDMLPNIIENYNEYQLEKYIEEPPLPPEHFDFTQCKGDACNILEEGTRVRIPLEEPRKATNLQQKLSGNFRASDLRYNPEIKTITKVLLRPRQPPLYVVDQDDLVAYPKEELQIIDFDNEDNNRDAQTIFLPKKIKSENETEYQIEWKDFPEPEHWTWEPKNKIQEIAPNLILEWDIEN